MPQYQQLKKGYARVRILSKDATRAYMLLMRHAGGRLQVLPDDRYVVDEALLQLLKDNGIEHEIIEQK